MADPIEEIAAALRAGDAARAEKLARDRLDAVPNESLAFSLLGEALLAKGDTAEAERVLAQPAVLAVRPDSYDLLASAQYRLSAFDRCEATLETRAAMDPPMPALNYRILAKLKITRGAVEDGKDVLARAIGKHPKDFQLVVAHADLAFANDPTAASQAIEQHLERFSSSPSAVSYLLKRLAIYRVDTHKTQQKASSYPASWADIWRWPDPEGFGRFERALIAEVQSSNASAGAYLDLACIALGRQAGAQAGKIFDMIRSKQPGTYADAAGFGPRFHAELDAIADQDLSAGLVPVHRLTQPEFDGPVVYLASDPHYFARFTLPLLRAFQEKSPGINVQVHIMDGVESDWRELLQVTAGMDGLRLGMSAENSGARASGYARSRFYYHAVRFIRFYEELKHLEKPMWLLDVDAQVLKDPRDGFAQLANYDLAVAGQWCELEPAMKIWACCVGVSPTAHGLAYLSRVAAYVSYWLRRKKNVWGTDQLALLSCYAHHVDQGNVPKTLFLQPDFVGAFGETTGALRFMGGLKKYQDQDSA